MSYDCNHNGVMIGYGSGPHRKLASWTMSHGVSHATVARRWDENLLDAPIAGRVLFVSGLLCGPKRFGEDDLYLPAPSALLRRVQGAGVAAHLVTYRTRALRPYSPIGSPANIFVCCPRYAEGDLSRLAWLAAARPFRNGTILFVVRSDEALTTTLCDEQRRQPGLSVAEVQLAQLLAMNKAKAVTQAFDEYVLEQETIGLATIRPWASTYPILSWFMMMSHSSDEVTTHSS
ncbi:hypothetical protein FOZ61_010622 [Perkinsus olseni]|uniref:Uncharacterized protein n=1 Tax=Perkinsus olseni TaxID=32597 RepID=A0A7J6KVD7_PEROL|nr:hypothetical protein FOZ61_010622 [Perkinsus olseni]